VLRIDRNAVLKLISSIAPILLIECMFGVRHMLVFDIDTASTHVIAFNYVIFLFKLLRMSMCQCHHIWISERVLFVEPLAHIVAYDTVIFTLSLTKLYNTVIFIKLLK
jgi:hypothetical protein